MNTTDTMARFMTDMADLLDEMGKHNAARNVREVVTQYRNESSRIHGAAPALTLDECRAWCDGAHVSFSAHNGYVLVLRDGSQYTVKRIASGEKVVCFSYAQACDVLAVLGMPSDATEWHVC